MDIHAHIRRAIAAIAMITVWRKAPVMEDAG